LLGSEEITNERKNAGKDIAHGLPKPPLAKRKAEVKTGQNRSLNPAQNPASVSRILSLFSQLSPERRPDAGLNGHLRKPSQARLLVRA